MKYWEIIADRIHRAGWSWGYSKVYTPDRGLLWLVDANRSGVRHIVHADELLSAFLELERQLPL